MYRHTDLNVAFSQQQAPSEWHTSKAGHGRLEKKHRALQATDRPVSAATLGEIRCPGTWHPVNEG